jgi:uncharacterized membrane protein (UPF0182 family)
VIVAYQNQIVMEETLDEALDKLFRSEPRSTPAGGVVAARDALQLLDAGAGSPALSSDPIVAQAREHYQRALQAQREGNWASYGEEIERLGAVIERLGGVD